MDGAAVLSKRMFFEFGDAKTGGAIAEETVKILRALGGRINSKGRIVGHLKCMVRSGGHYVQFSAANFPDISVKAGPGWYEREYGRVELIVNAIVFGYSKEQLEEFLNDSREGSIFYEGSGKSGGRAFR